MGYIPYILKNYKQELKSLEDSDNELIGITCSHEKPNIILAIYTNKVLGIDVVKCTEDVLYIIFIRHIFNFKTQFHHNE